jgi:phosphatidylglycerol lysyltransferase
MAHGWNAMAYQILNPGILLWFGAAGDSVVGYARHRRVRVVAGAPVCEAERLAAVVAEFEADAARVGERVCYFGAGTRLEELSERPLRPMVLLGAQPVWHPSGWDAIVGTRQSLRAQLNRARNKGVTVRRWPREEAEGSAALERCLTEWLGTRGLPPLHFLVEPATLGSLGDREVFVAEREGEPVGFVIATPVPRRDGWLVEQIIRGRGAPNGTNELMLDATMRAAARAGRRYVTLGLSPLSTRAGVAEPPTPLWLRLALRWTRAHGRRFYNFDGLDAFKAKFRPDSWEPIYAISAERRFSLGTLYAIAGAFSAGSPVVLVLRALWMAVRAEAARARRRRAAAGVSAAPAAGRA